MQTLASNIQDYATVFFFGLAKNAGKTTALRQAMSEYRAIGKPIIVSSIGRDGEKYDAVYKDYVKPRLEFSYGDIVITARKLITKKVLYNQLKTFKGTCPMGNLVAIEVLSPCEVEVAGPIKLSDLYEIKSWISVMYGKRTFLIDGAFSRKAAAQLGICDGVVVSTGASVADNEEKALSKTITILKMLTLPIVSEQETKGITVSPIQDRNHDIVSSIANILGEEKRVVVNVEGAVTDSFVHKLWRFGLLGKIRIIVDCFSKVSISSDKWDQYCDAGMRVYYRYRTPVLSITVNPTSPEGVELNSDSFVKRLKRSLSNDVPIFNVRSDDYLNNSVLDSATDIQVSLSPLRNKSNFAICEFQEAHLSQVWEINQKNGESLSFLSLSEFSQLSRLCSYAAVALHNGKVIGFIFALKEDVNYDNANYSWFCQRYNRFIYVDRLAVSKKWRGYGVGKLLYKSVFESYYGKRDRSVCCEVNLSPPNPVSSMFHRKIGFVQEGTMIHGNKTVEMLVKECS